MSNQKEKETIVQSEQNNYDSKNQVPVVFFGRLELRKGIATFIDAIKLLEPNLKKQIHVYFIGKNVHLHASRLGEICSDQYIEQELAAQISYTILSALYSQEAIQFILNLKHPIVCLASHQENFPNAGLEMGQLPIRLVVSDTGGFRETLHLVNRTSGVYWFKPADCHALAKKLTKAIAAYPEEPQVAAKIEIEHANQALLKQRLGLIEQAFQKPPAPTARQPKVTVGITCYNLGKYLMECLVSVESQTYKNLEVIVFDDASDDQETQDIILHARSIFPDYRYVQAEINLGLGSARNRIIEMATGDYFLPLDADNRLLPFAVEKFVEAALHSDASIVVSSMLYFGVADGVHSFRFTSLPSLLQLNTCGDACSLFSMSIVRQFKHTERQDCSTHDWCIMASAIASDERIVHYPYPLYEYRMRHNSMIKQASAPKEQYYLRQYLAQIPPAKWSPRQLYMLLMATQHLQAQLEAERSRSSRLETIQAEANQLRTQFEELTHTYNQSRITQEQLVSEKQEEINLFTTRLERRQSQIEILLSRIAAMESSKLWKMRIAWFRLKRLFKLSKEDISPFSLNTENDDYTSNSQQEPPYQPEQESLVDFLPEQESLVDFQPSEQVNHSDIPQPDPYERWMQLHDPKPADLQRMTKTAEVFGYKPLISILLPVFDPPEHFLREAIESVIAQAYPHWELCIADDASTEPYVRKVLQKYATQNSRIKLIFREKNGHVSCCSNSALELATGEFIALLDHDDLLAPEALYEVAFLLNKHPEADMIYSDEDKLTENGKRCTPFFKPDWCPDSFLSRMYTCHLGVYRRAIVSQVGGFRVGYEGSQDYDLVLRFTEHTDKVFHIPQILYHWRIHEKSTATNLDVKPYACLAAKKALTEALYRRGESGIVKIVPGFPGVYNIRYHIKSYDLVSIIIPTKDLGHILNQCLESIFTESTYPNYEVILIDNGSTELYTAKVIADWLDKEPNRFRCYEYKIPFNYSKLNNFAVSKAQGKLLLFLNNDTEVITSDWIEAMVEQAQRSSIGVVGVKLLYPNNTIQHSGVVLGPGRVATHGHRYFPAASPGYFCQLISINNYSAVTGACVMCRREVFDLVGGFTEELAVGFNDIDFCLKIVDKGLRNIYLPHVVLFHYESKTRGFDFTPEKQARFFQEAEYMEMHWQQLIDRDPCYNPNLTREPIGDYKIKIPQEVS